MDLIRFLLPPTKSEWAWGVVALVIYCGLWVCVVRGH